MGASLKAGVIENRGIEKTSRVGFRDFRSQGAVLIHEERISNVSHALVMLVHTVFAIREGVKKSKWKFKMAFAMKGGGLEGVSSATYLF